MNNNTQKRINDVCEYRGLPEVKKGAACEVNGQAGLIWGGNGSANFNVKFNDSNAILNCHPYWKMKIFNDDGTILYEHLDT